MAHHEFELFLTIDQTVVTRPDCGSAPLKVGDTVAFKSPHGAIEIAWTTDSFNSPVYTDGDVATASAVGPFSGLCTITRSSGEKLKYAGGTEGTVESGDTPATGNTK